MVAKNVRRLESRAKPMQARTPEGPESERIDITFLLKQMSHGDEAARAEVWSHLYDELKRCASREARRGGDAVRATELIGQVFTRMARLDGKEWQNRGHFISMAVTAMRTAIVDHVRSNTHGRQSPLDSVVSEVQARVDGDLLGFYDELELFREIDPEMAHAVEMKAFGYRGKEIAALLGIPERTFNRKFERARARLQRKLRWTQGSGDE